MSETDSEQDGVSADNDPVGDDFVYTPEDPSDLIGAVNFEELSPTDFEEFCFDLLEAAGFENMDWRKGTPKPGSPSDQGRDIVACRSHSDVDGFTYREKWFVDAKHYKSAGVPPDALNSTLAWAEAERPDVVLFVLSGFLSNGSKNMLDRYIENNRPRFRIRYWELPQLRSLIAKHQDVAFKHDVGLSTLRRASEILEKEKEITDRLWYGRKPSLDDPWWQKHDVDMDAIAKSFKEIEERVGVEALEMDVSSDFSWGALTGAAFAIRWVLGDDWGNADS
ncbi:restriction endonuclease [Rhodococcus erythropolis]|uniref:restriction endonuclease n=1 Tax=Rhodococcus erythropolis TaxID=1833 RepID=UPI003A4E600F